MDTFLPVTSVLLKIYIHREFITVLAQAEKLHACAHGVRARLFEIIRAVQVACSDSRSDASFGLSLNESLRLTNARQLFAAQSVDNAVNSDAAL